MTRNRHGRYSKIKNDKLETLSCCWISFVCCALFCALDNKFDCVEAEKKGDKSLIFVFNHSFSPVLRTDNYHTPAVALTTSPESACYLDVYIPGHCFCPRLARALLSYPSIP